MLFRSARTIGADALLAERAAWLAKADLLTAMVGEFPELRGVMGRIYAQVDGETPQVAQAIEEHYWPLTAEGELPRSAASAVASSSARSSAGGPGAAKTMS